MASNRTDEVVKGASAFLAVFVPQLAPFLPAVPGLINMVRGAFTKIGGKDSDLDAILAANDIDIKRLKDPNSFRTRGPRK